MVKGGPTTPSTVSLSWRTAGHSVRGAGHVREGLPNQDAVQCRDAAGTEPYALAAVADGHGGSRHFRSADGARLAVQVSQRILRASAPQLDTATPAERATLVHDEVPLRIVQTWVAAAREHLDAHPILADEWAALERAEGADAAASVQADPLLAYGATLLAAIVTPRCIAMWQLGDGDILAVAPGGHTHRPVPSDERLGGNLTTSLCRPGAQADFRSAVIEGDAVRPVLLLLSTDGYANSFRTDADFLQVGIDYHRLLCEHGLETVASQLGDILNEASHQGSGDDITLALLFDASAGGIAQAAPAAATAPTRSALIAEELHRTRAQLKQLQGLVGALVAAVVVAAVWYWRVPLQGVLQPTAQPQRPMVGGASGPGGDPGFAVAPAASAPPVLGGGKASAPKTSPGPLVEPAKPAASHPATANHPKKHGD